MVVGVEGRILGLVDGKPLAANSGAAGVTDQEFCIGGDPLVVLGSGKS